MVYIVEQMENAFFSPRVMSAEGPDAPALHQFMVDRRKSKRNGCHVVGFKIGGLNHVLISRIIMWSPLFCYKTQHQN